MNSNGKKKIPVKEGFWTTPDQGGKNPQLIGSKCSHCEEVYFPKKQKNWCVHCQNKGLKDILLSRTGKLASFSVVMQQPGGGFYKGPVPYSYGLIDLSEGIRIESLLSADNFDDLEVGMEMEMIIEKLHEDEEGNEIITFKFNPAS